MAISDFFGSKDARDLERRARELEVREAAVGVREEMVRRQQEEAEARDKRLAERDADLAALARDLREREVKAQAGFPEQSRAAMKDIDAALAALDARRQAFQDLGRRAEEQIKAAIEREGAVAAREWQVKERELKADAGFAVERDAALREIDRRAAALDAREAALKAAEAAVDAGAARVAGREAGLADRERAVREREAAADAGFAEKNRAALAELQKEHDALVERVARLNAELSQARQAALAELRSELDREAADRRAADEAAAAGRRAALAEVDRRHAELRQRADELEADLARARADRFAALDREAAAEADRRWKALAEQGDRARADAAAALDADLARRRAAFDADCDARAKDVDRQKQEADRRAAEAEAREAEVQRLAVELKRGQRALAVDRETFEEDRQSAIRRAEAKVAERAAETQAALERQEALVRRVQAERDRLRERLDALEEVYRRFGDKSPEQVLKELYEVQAESDRLRDQLAARPGPEVLLRLDALAAEKAKWDEERARLYPDLARLRAAQHQWQRGADELERQAEQREAAERNLDALRGLMDKYRDDVNRLRSLYEQPKEIAARIGVIERPLADLAALPRSNGQAQAAGGTAAAAGGAAGEVGWLEQVLADCEGSGLSFNKRLLYAFHTSLKTAEWSPLTVMAGVSGTGKSELPRLYARYGGLAFLPLAVQPNWDSPQSLFGFFNSVDNRFNATPLLQALAQSARPPDEAGGLDDALLLVLLDEINLAHVELYFSDLLSKLELRRGHDGPVHVDIDLGAGVDKYPLRLGRNVLWAGTMNEDETTKALSDKVLDRGNLINFPRPRELKRRERPRLGPQRPLLSGKTWRAWGQGAATFQAEQVQPYKDLLQQMNEHLEKVGRALGHRVWQSAESYMANYPTVVRAAAAGAGQGDELKRAMRIAFEDQLAQKVMPKLRGIETPGRADDECLTPIQKLLAEFGLHALAEDFVLARSTGYGAFVWRSAKYLEAAE